MQNITNADVIKKQIFTDKDANIRIRIKNAIKKTEEQRLKQLEKKPLSTEEKIISNLLRSAK